jgi:hypothetical protein
MEKFLALRGPERIAKKRAYHSATSSFMASRGRVQSKVQEKSAKQSASAKPMRSPSISSKARAAGPWQSSPGGRREWPFRLLCPSRKLNRHLDCHGATRLAMTKLEVNAQVFLHFGWHPQRTEDGVAIGAAFVVCDQ